MEVLFFPSIGVSKCMEHFPMYNLRTEEQWNLTLNRENTIILCHGKGIKQAIDWCEQQNIIPKIIVSMDGMSLYGLDTKKYNICLLRQAWKCKLKDVDYNCSIYYSGTNHHPYTDVKLRDVVVKFIKEHM